MAKPGPTYCKLDQDRTGASSPRSEFARDFVNFRTTTRSDHDRTQLAQLAICHDGVRIWIFDDPAANERGQCPEFCFAQLYSSRSIDGSYFIIIVRSLKHPWLSPKNFRFRYCRRSFLDQNMPRITNSVSDLTKDQ